MKYKFVRIMLELRISHLLYIIILVSFGTNARTPAAGLYTSQGGPYRLYLSENLKEITVFQEPFEYSDNTCWAVAKIKHISSNNMIVYNDWPGIELLNDMTMGLRNKESDDSITFTFRFRIESDRFFIPDDKMQIVLEEHMADGRMFEHRSEASDTVIFKTGSSSTVNISILAPFDFTSGITYMGYEPYMQYFSIPAESLAFLKEGCPDVDIEFPHFNLDAFYNFWIDDEIIILERDALVFRGHRYQLRKFAEYDRDRYERMIRFYNNRKDYRKPITTELL